MNDLELLLNHFVRSGIISPELDVDFYRSCQIDLLYFDDDAIRHHFLAHGAEEGRIGTPAAHRRGFIAQIPMNVPVLEIGPAVRPSLVGPFVKYFEIETRDELLTRAARESYPVDRCPDNIDFVSKAADLSVVDEKFDATFSSHCIEHQPDLIAHLLKIKAIVKPGGRYFLLVPDKRYCFDALLPASTVEDVFVAHLEGRTVHTEKNVYAHYVDTTHNDTPRHWNGDHGQANNDVAGAKGALEKAQGSYVDVHAWQFTPDAFRLIMQAIEKEFPEIGMVVERVYATVRNRNEFGAILRF